MSEVQEEKLKCNMKGSKNKTNHKNRQRKETKISENKKEKFKKYASSDEELSEICLTC